jgi:hypothetical protein
MKGIDVDFAFLPIDTLTVRGGFEIMSSQKCPNVERLVAHN